MKAIVLIIASILIIAGCRLGYNVKSNSFDVTLTPEDVIELYDLIIQRKPIDNGQVITLDSGLRVRMITVAGENKVNVEDPQPLETWGD